MRSPWKILSDLTSRKRVREEKESTEVEHDAPDAASEVEQSPKRLSLPEETSERQEEHEKSVAVVTENSQPESSPAVSLEPHVDDADEHKSDVVAEADNNPKAPALPTQSSKRKPSPIKAAPTQTRIRAESKPDKTGGAPLQQSQAADPFLSELGELDDEIQQLRVTLASKLQLQNAQLRKMLDRFGSH
jgi:hypothetical protein